MKNTITIPAHVLDHAAARGINLGPILTQLEPILAQLLLTVLQGVSGTPATPTKA